MHIGAGVGAATGTVGRGMAGKALAWGLNETLNTYTQVAWINMWKVKSY